MNIDWTEFLTMGGGVVGLVILAVVFMWAVMWLLIPVGVFAISGELQKLHGTLKRIERLLSSSRPPAAPPPAHGNLSDDVPNSRFPNPFLRH